jgi:predicted alpha/beta-fold hydrolase
MKTTMQRFTLEFQAENWVMSACEITHFPDSGVIVVTDEDSGSSVTNSAEVIAANLKESGLEWEVLVEHYRGKRGDPTKRADTFGNKETFDLVECDWSNHRTARIGMKWVQLPLVDWKPFTRAKLEELIGCEFPE